MLLGQETKYIAKVGWTTIFINLTSVDPKAIKQLSASSQHQECINACQSYLSIHPESSFHYKYAGKSLIALGKYLEARDYLARANELNADDPETSKEIGNTYLRLHDTPNALKWYLNSLKINPGYPPALCNIAFIYKRDGRLIEAENLFMQAIDSDPTTSHAYVGLSQIYLQSGRYNDVISIINNALCICKSIPGMHEVAGIASQNLGNLENALLYYSTELQHNPESYNSLFNSSLILLQQGKAKSALELLHKISVTESNDQFTLLLAQTYQKLGSFKQAIVEYKKLHHLQSVNKIISLNLGICFLGLGETRESINHLQLSIAIDRASVDPWLNIGIAFQKEHRYNEAIDAFKRVLEIDPQNTAALHLLEALFKSTGRLDDAIDLVNKALEEDPTNEDIITRLGSLYYDIGDFELAIKYTRQSLELSPFNPKALSNVAYFYRAQGDLKKSIKYLHKLSECNPDNAYVFMNIGITYYELGDPKRALSNTLACLELDPKNSDALANLGLIYRQLGDSLKALEFTREALQVHPTNYNALINLSQIYLDLRDLDNSLLALHSILDTKPTDFHALFNLGNIYLELGDLDKALIFTRRSLGSNPEDHKSLLNMGIIYNQLGKSVHALEFTNQALEIDPHNPDALLNLGGIYINLGNFDRALDYTLQCLDHDIHNPTALMNLGIIYECLGNLELALDSYQRSAFLLDSHHYGSSLTSLVASLAILLQLEQKTKAQTTLQSIAQIVSKPSLRLQGYGRGNLLHDQGYITFLDRLIPLIPHHKQDHGARILHLGDSHCLSFAWQTLEYNGQQSIIQPCLIRGAKAFHLGLAQNKNRFKVSLLKRWMDNRENSLAIFLSFGEIDCRSNEGIIKYCQKYNHNYIDVAKQTAENYLDWIVDALATDITKLVIIGTPAPFKSEKSTDTYNPKSTDALRLSVVQSFNKTLADKCSSLRLKFADTYLLTAGSDGFNDGHWMVDSFHLKPDALSQLINQFVDQP